MAKTDSADIVIIGGGPGGMTSAIFSRLLYPKKSIIVVKDVNEGVVPCGTPYMFHTMNHPRDNVLACARAEGLNIDLRHGYVSKINRKLKNIETSIGNISYTKLILASGSNPIVPSIKGIEKKGVFEIIKDYAYLSKLNSAFKKSRNIVIIGGGFIGVEFADEIASMKNKKVTLVELLPCILNNFDSEISSDVQRKLEKKGVKVITKKSVTEILGKNNVSEVLLSDGSKIKSELVLLGIGAKPNTKLAEDAGLKLTKRRAVKVNRYMESSDKTIIAVGDCASKKDFFNHKESAVMLASTAAGEAKIASVNLFMPRIMRPIMRMGENKGTLPIYATCVGDQCFGSAGLTEKMAKDRGLKYVVGSGQNFDKHPETMPGTHVLKVKLIFSKFSRRLIGAEISGGASVGEITNMLGLAIQNKLKLSALRDMQIGSHPLLTSAPTFYPISIAAMDAMAKLMGMDLMPKE